MASRRHREPTTPGELLLEAFLKPLQITQVQLAKHLDCDFKLINRIVNGRTRITANVALRLAAALQTTPDFWLNAQNAVDVYRARQTTELPPPIKAQA